MNPWQAIVGYLGLWVIIAFETYEIAAWTESATTSIKVICSIALASPIMLAAIAAHLICYMQLPPKK